MRWLLLLAALVAWPAAAASPELESPELESPDLESPDLESPDLGALLQGLNAARLEAGLPALAPDPTLTRISADYATLMAEQDCLAHDCDGHYRVVTVGLPQ